LAGAPQARWRRYAWQLLCATGFTTVLIVFAKPSDQWWVTSGELPRVAMLAALFALGGFAYLGVLYCFGFRVRDVQR
jgi:peptidoglycan biosynthesis protein MviN/MurJ (putative lipid II flippase)